MCFLSSTAHSPDNTFLGFVVNAQPTVKNTVRKSRRKAKALVYGKHVNMWKVRTKNVTMVPPED